jgi:undecaprenyl diphosphate synthase
MSEITNELIADAGERMKKSVESTRHEFGTVRTGRASAGLLDRIVVDYYGAPTPLKQMATISAPEARLLTVQPYDSSSIKAIEKAIMESDVGLTPNNDGKLIRLGIPELNEERRKELVRVVRHIAEEGRVAIRNIRRDCMQDLRELKGEGEVGADDESRAEKELQKLTDARVHDLDEALKAKEAEILEVSVAAAAEPPRYVAIITDGNGRWARARGLEPIEGHRAGADVVKARLRDAVELGIRELTVYSFSTENWSRPAEEVTGLMRMFSERILGETPELDAEGVRMRFIGRREGVSSALIEQMDWAEQTTAANDRITLFVAFNYGGRAEILDAAERDTGGGEEAFRELLYAPEMHDPDLIIRTSGEQRTSNYLLWQSAYSELVFRDELWPDFTRESFEACLDVYASRRRRFGGR